MFFFSINNAQTRNKERAIVLINSISNEQIFEKKNDDSITKKKQKQKLML